MPTTIKPISRRPRVPKLSSAFGVRGRRIGMANYVSFVGSPTLGKGDDAGFDMNISPRSHGHARLICNTAASPSRQPRWCLQRGQSPGQSQLHAWWSTAIASIDVFRCVPHCKEYDSLADSEAKHEEPEFGCHVVSPLRSNAATVSPLQSNFKPMPLLL